MDDVLKEEPAELKDPDQVAAMKKAIKHIEDRLRDAELMEVVQKAEPGTGAGAAIAAAEPKYSKGGLVSSGGPVGTGKAYIAPTTTTTTTTGPWFGGTVDPKEPEKPIEHVLFPTKIPGKVLVAFLDENGEVPFWAAYLEPVDLDLFINPLEPGDATMSLKLSLVKKFDQ